MSMHNLTAVVMIAITNDLLNNLAKRALLERAPLTSALIPHITEAHQALVVLTRQDGAVKARLQALSAQLALLDIQHDRFSRGLYRSLDAAADLAATAEEGRPFVEVRDILHPEALLVNTLSYRAQSGNTLQVKERATAAVRAVLARIVVNGRTLEQSLDDWIDTGQRMGELVAERSSLAGDDDDTRVSAGDLRHARQRWIRVLDNLLSTLDLIEMPAEDRRHLLANFHEAESQAAKTRASERPGGQDVDAGDIFDEVDEPGVVEPVSGDLPGPVIPDVEEPA